METGGSSFEKRFQNRMRAKSSDAFYFLCVEGGALWYGHNTAVVMHRFPHKQSEEWTGNASQSANDIRHPLYFQTLKLRLNICLKSLKLFLK